MKTDKKTLILTTLVCLLPALVGRGGLQPPARDDGDPLEL